VGRVSTAASPQVTIFCRVVKFLLGYTLLMRRSAAPTLKDVAEIAGVSTMLASVVLNGARSTTRVSPVSRLRIQEAAAQLGYRRNALAHGLTRNLLDTIGVVTDINGAELNLYFLEIFYGILEAATEYRQNTTVFSINNWENDADRILQFFDGRVDGIIFIAPITLPLPLLQSLQYHTPFVTLHSNIRNNELTDIDIDDESGAYLMVQYLLAQGHRRIAHFTGSQEIRGARLRLQGYCRALEDARIPRDDSLIIPCIYSLNSGRACMEQFLEETPAAQLPTAIFCANDTLAYGCVEVLAAHGIRIPEQISVAGFDDSLMARLTQPPLTTICQPFRRMGQRAVERLLPKIRNDISPTSKDADSPIPFRRLPDTDTEVFDVELIVRDSVRPFP